MTFNLYEEFNKNEVYISETDIYWDMVRTGEMDVIGESDYWNIDDDKYPHSGPYLPIFEHQEILAVEEVLDNIIHHLTLHLII